MLDALGHIGYSLLGVGVLLLGRRVAAGWLFRLVGQAVWLAIGIALGMSSIYVWSTAFLVLDAVGYYRWREKCRDHTLHSG